MPVRDVFFTIPARTRKLESRRESETTTETLVSGTLRRATRFPAETGFLALRTQRRLEGRMLAVFGIIGAFFSAWVLFFDFPFETSGPTAAAMFAYTAQLAEKAAAVTKSRACPLLRRVPGAVFQSVLIMMFLWSGAWFTSGWRGVGEEAFAPDEA